MGGGRAGFILVTKEIPAALKHKKKKNKSKDRIYKGENHK